MEDLSKEKSRLVEIVEKLKSSLPPDELKEINRLYDKYISIKRADLTRLQAYKDFLQSYFIAKYGHKKDERIKKG